MSGPEFVIADLGGAWVRLDRIEAMEASSAFDGWTRIELSGGAKVRVKGTPQEVADRIASAMDRADGNPTPTPGPLAYPHEGDQE